MPTFPKFLLQLTQNQGQISTYTVEDVQWSVSLVLLSVFGVCDNYTPRNNLRHTPLLCCFSVYVRIRIFSRRARKFSVLTSYFLVRKCAITFLACEEAEKETNASPQLLLREGSKFCCCLKPANKLHKSHVSEKGVCDRCVATSCKIWPACTEAK